MGFYTHDADKRSGHGLAITEWNDLSNAVAGNAGLHLALSSADNVGIGTDNPKAKLQVSGGAIMPAAGNSLTSGIFFPRNPGGGGADAAWIRYYVRSGEAMTLELGTSNDLDDHIALNPSGNVGIANSAPTEKLDVNGKVKATHFIGDGSQLTNLTVGLNGLNLATNGGNVGIGTSRPYAKVHVKSNRCELRIENTADNEWAFLRIKGPGKNRWDIAQYDNSDTLQFRPNESDNGRIMFRQNGYVGIGNTSPQAHLSIGGNGGKVEDPNSAMHITPGCILFGGNNDGEHTHSAQISAGKHIENSLNIVGMSSDAVLASRRVDLWAEGGFFIRGNNNTFTIKTDNQKLMFQLANTYYGGSRGISWDGDTNWDSNSDLRLKSNIVKEENILQRLVQLDVKNYTWKGETDRKRPKMIGFVAQDVQPLFPALVGEVTDPDSDETTLTLKYANFGVLAVGAIKEMKQEYDQVIASLKKEIRGLKESLKV